MADTDPTVTLFERAKRHRIPMAVICKRANVDPTTPSRWKRGKNGATLDKVTLLHGALSEIIEEQAA